jgi:NADPH2:quinone reductase
MRALVLHDTTGPEALTLEERDAPAVLDGMVAVEVHAAGAGFVDWLVTKGEYQIRPPLPFVPGIEVAGTVDGRRVCATVAFGGFAEVALAPGFAVFDLPDSMTFAQGAAMVTNFQTAHLALLRRGRLTEGERVLVLGGAGGVGLASIAVAKAAGAAHVAAAVSTEERAQLAREAGADTVHVGDEEWEHADVVVDPVGGEAFKRGLKALRPEGRLLVVGFASGTIPELPVNRLLLRHTEVIGVNYGGMLTVDMGFPQAAWGDLAHWFEEGRLPLPGISEHPLEELPGALRALGERRMTGKPVALVR